MSRINVLAFSLLAAASLHAQVTGRITGSVVDASGGAIPNAVVNLYLRGGTVPVISTKTTSEGIFTFAAVRPETYRLTVEVTGFAPYKIPEVRVEAAREIGLPAIRLEVASAAQSVEVSSGVQTLDTTTAEISTTVTQAQVDNLPVLDRQVSFLFQTQAGVANSRTVTAINGLRSTYSDVTYDGVNIQDNYIRTNTLDFIPNKLTIGEVAELTVSSGNTALASLANGNGAILTSPSGGNAIHGSVYWYNRNSATAANDWFSNKNGVARPQLNLNQFGGTVGGPVKKDKLFYYAAYETYNLHQGTPVRNTILTPSARQGILTLSNGSRFNLLQDNNLTINSATAAKLAAIPTVGNSTEAGDQRNTTGYFFNARSNERRDSVLGKADFNLSTRNVFAGSFRWNRDIVDRPDLGNFYTSVPPVSNDGKAKFFSVAWRFSATPTLTNELRGGGNLTHAPFNVAGDLPAFVTTGLTFTDPVNAFLPQGRNTDTYNIQDNVNWVKGRHSLGFGVQTQQVRVYSYAYGGTVPNYTVSVFADPIPYGYNTGDIPGANATDTNMANSLLATLGGLISDATQTFNITSRSSGFVAGAPQTQNLTFGNFAGYAADRWRVHRNLTLDLGVRWDYFTRVNERDALLLQPQLIDNNAVSTLLGNATLDFAGNAIGRSLYKRDLNNFAPNVGFAWNVFGHSKTSIRGGYTIRYVNDDTVEAVLLAATANSGLQTANSTLNIFGKLNAPPAIPAPRFQVPITTAQNWIVTGRNAVEGLIDPNLVTPYVQQWAFSIQRDVKGTIFEARYIGNHSVKQFRQIDYNQIQVQRGGFLQDFINARNNGLAAQRAGGAFNPAYNPNIPGSVPLPFFTSQLSPQALTNTSVRTSILQGQVGTAAQTIQQNNYFLNPAFSFFPNPNLLYSSILTNIGNSSYHGLQLEARHRTARGIQFQANYTFSKVLSDTGVLRGLEALLDNNNPRQERARSIFDLTHAFKLNHTIPLPMGKGHRFSGGKLSPVVGGWSISGFLQIQSGAPVSILSARGTLNRGARSANNTVDTTLNLDQLKAITGVFKTGSDLYFIKPENINPTTRTGVAPDGTAPFPGQVFFNPAAGTLGSLQRRILDGPGFGRYDLSLAKDTRLGERASIQFRADAFNVTNHPNFFVADQNVNSTTFGRITSMYYGFDGVGPRVMQFGMFVKF